ncbi:unnamed protein product [Dibothriocephalus latus]|uniref:Uncharacterized protein n=1 Tax=Dibothriocephalus latus TaxID=60516 RepID=A0A3P7NRQ1_DIBLA|nr:unnamed protein product [Dibothriocephalus latus]
MEEAGLSTVIKGTAPLLNADETTPITGKSPIRKRWAEHFQSVFNRPSIIFDAVVDQVLQMETKADFGHPPTFPETKRVIQQLSSEKARRSDTTPTGIYKYGGRKLMKYPFQRFQEIWHPGQVAQGFLDAKVIHS